MKIKLKIDKKTVQQFLIQHGEKIGLGCALLLVLLIVYSAFSTMRGQKFNKTPEELIKRVGEKETLIGQTKPETGLTVPDYVAKAKKSRDKIVEGPYAYAVDINPAIFPTRRLRPTPPLFAVQDLRPTAELGAFAVLARNARAGADRNATEVGGRRWVSLTGLVPVKKQETEYKEAFSGTVQQYSPQTDVPDYLGYWVERIEVASPGDAVNPDWSKAKKIRSVDAVKAAGLDMDLLRSADVVAQKYKDPRGAMAFPLGPRVDKPWGPSVAHLTEIPLQSSDRVRPGGGMEGPMGPMGPAGPMHQPGMPPKPHAGGGEADAHSDDNPFGGQETRPAEGDKTQPTEPEATPDDPNAAAEFYLFRFIDFSVEPGKHYVYRVRAVLQNPNKGLKANLLEKPDDAKVAMLESGWSEPSPVVSVPRDGHILAGAVTPARAADEATAALTAVQFVPKRGIQAHNDFTKIKRGQWANFPKVRIDPPAAGQGGMGGAGTSTRPLYVHFVTDSTVIDFRGGGKLPGRKDNPAPNEPGEILVLDPNGNLSVHDEMDDMPAREALTEASAAPTAGPGGMMMGPGMEPGMEPGMGPMPPKAGGALDTVPTQPKKKTPKPKTP